jgi:NADP-dependent aldehyde dehydrogenase
MELRGTQLIGGADVPGSGPLIRGTDRSTGAELEPPYPSGSSRDVQRTGGLAAEAFGVYRATTAEQRAVFLESIASGIEELGSVLVERAHQESGLPLARIESERGRTTGQLRLFASVLRAGDWNGARIDQGTPDLRQRKIPLGPVAVFGASNFPLAFSVAGGDTAAALAAGCPVVVKAHEAHPGTSELVGRVIVAAAASCGLPAGTFTLLYGDGPTLGTALATDPRIKAVGFTGSRGAGLALVAAAAARPEPIPVFAEMSSVNPVFVLPGALAARPQELAEAYVASLTLGSGQFCTNPGILVAADGPGFKSFLDAAATAVAGVAAAPMLTDRIAQSFTDGLERLSERPGVEVLARSGGGALLVSDAERFLADAALRDEVFGPSSLIVRCSGVDELEAVARSFTGELTATLHTTDDDLPLAGLVLPILELKAGRIVFNGWPTGVAVNHAIVHGGPFPATSDGRTTSVGSLAIERFLRPVSYQDAPAALLPSVLTDANPLGLDRLVNGKLAR